jgi:hypothetical protein
MPLSQCASWACIISKLCAPFRPAAGHDGPQRRTPHSAQPSDGLRSTPEPHKQAADGRSCSAAPPDLAMADWMDVQLASPSAPKLVDDGADGGAPGDAADLGPRPLPASSAAIANLPSCGPGAFSCFRPLSDDDPEPPRYIPALHDPARPPPIKVTTDRTKCLIRALRAKQESAGLRSAALVESLHPDVCALQAAQREQQRVQLAKTTSRSAVARRRRLTAWSPAASGPAGDGGSGDGRSGASHSFPSSAGQAAAPDRTAPGRAGGADAGGSAGASRPLKRPRTQRGWGELSRERRQLCIRVCLAAAVRRSPSPAVAEMDRIWRDDPGRPQRVTAAIRRELASHVKHWTLSELMAYADGAGLLSKASPAGAPAPRRELANAVCAHLRPDGAASDGLGAGPSASTVSGASGRPHGPVGDDSRAE